MLFLCTSGKQFQGKRDSTLMIPTVFAGDRGQQVEKKNILSALGHCSSSARGIPWQESVSVLQTLSRCRVEPGEGVQGLLAPTESPSFLPRSSACKWLLWGVFLWHGHMDNRAGPLSQALLTHWQRRGMVSTRFMVLTWANSKVTLVQNFVLRKVLLIPAVEFPCLLPQCFAREQQDILADILREGPLPFSALLRRAENC